MVIKMIDDLALNYFNELKETPEFKELIELKNNINENYMNLIINLKTKESIYNEAKEKNYLTPSITSAFAEAKSKLYEKEEVKRYLKLEAIINEKLVNDFNEIKQNISKSYQKDSFIKL